MANPHHRIEVGARRWAELVIFGFTVALGMGCSRRVYQRSPNISEVKSLQLSTNDTRALPLDVLQNQVMRFADRYAVTVAQAVDEYLPYATTSAARLSGVRWKLNQATAAYVDATGPNPVLNALDLVVLATVARMVAEDSVDDVFGPHGLPILETHRQLEEDAWAAASRVMKSGQRQELKAMIEEWRRKNPHQRQVAATRLRELAVAVGRTPQASTAAPNSIFGLLFLDPLAGLDPTAAALEEAKQLAERAMYYTQRMPALLNWQVQVFTLQMAGQPEIQQILTNGESLVRSTETFSQVAVQLPKLVNDQREAAIKQVLDGIAVERTNLLGALDVKEQQVRELLTESRQTLTSGKELSASLDGTIKSLLEFVRYVSPPATNPAASDKSPPFNVLDYGTTASQIAVAAKDLNTLLSTLHQSLPEVAQLREQTTLDAQRVLRHAFWWGLALVLGLLAGAVLAGLAYRVAADKLRRRGILLPAARAFSDSASTSSRQHPQSAGLPNN